MPQVPASSSSRIRLSMIEEANIYTRMLDKEVWRTSGNTLEESCTEILSDISTASGPSNQFRSVPLTRLTATHLVNIFKRIPRKRIPDSAWEKVYISNSEGVEEPSVNENGSPVFETDDQGERVLSDALAPVQCNLYKNLYALQKKILSQRSSTEQSALQARERSREALEAGRFSVQRRQQTFVKQKAAINKRQRDERRRERYLFNMERQHRKSDSSSKMTLANASI